MKTVSNLFKYSFIVLALLMTACDKDDDTTTDPDDPAAEAGAEFLKATVDGAAYEAAQDPAVIVGATTSGTGASRVLAVQGGTNSGETIRVTIMGYDGPGTYMTGDDLSNASSLIYLTIDPVAAWSNDLTTPLVGGIDPGTIEVTSDDGSVVEGTFSFTGYNGDDMTTKVITNGSFKANFDE